MIQHIVKLVVALVTVTMIYSQQKEPGGLKRIDFLKQEKDVDGLIELARTPDWLTSSLAVLAIERIGNGEAVQALMELVENPSTWVDRVESARALARLAPEGAFDVLTGVLLDECLQERPEDTEPWVRRDAGTVDEVIEQQISFALNDYVSKDKDRYFPILEEMMLDEQLPFKFRAHIAILLGRHKMQSAFDLLVDCLGLCNSGRMRKQAIRSIERLGDRRAIPALIKALNDDYEPEYHGHVVGKQGGYPVRLAAWAALKTMGVKVIKEGDTYRVEE